MNIAVYLGSNNGNDPKYIQIAKELGAWIGDTGNCLVYGGAAWGLMGALADVALKHGAPVIGVIPNFIKDKGALYPKLTTLEVVETMSQRKQRMIDLSDVAIALPGGPGTLEEITEVISLCRLKQTSKQCFLYNYNEFWGDLRNLFIKMIDQGFLKPDELSQVHFVESIDEIAELLLQE